MKLVLPTIFILLLSVSNGYGQRFPVPENGMEPSDSSLYVVDTVYFAVKTGNCKSLKTFAAFIYDSREDTVLVQRVPVVRSSPPVISQKKKPFLAVHGNVMYDLFYQSHVDTPYMEKEVYQHTVQTVLDITVKDQYPLHLGFSTSKGNSSHFRNLTGLNLQYTNRDFKNALINKAREWDAGKLKQLKELETLKGDLEKKWQEVNRLKGWFTSPSQVQRMVELREKELYAQLPDKKMPDLPAKMKLPLWDLPEVDVPKPPVDTSGMRKMKQEYETRKQQLDSLQSELAGLQRVYEQKQKVYGVRKAQLIDVLKSSRNNKELADNLSALNLPDTILPKGYKTLLAFKSVGLGRTMVDYSELTVKNVSITGFQAEFNPSYYLAFASGAIDYRFRDFVVNTNRIRQYVNIVRVGLGMREGNNLILSYYTGKKQVYNVNTSGGGGTVEAPDYRIMGMSLEGKWQLDRNNYIIGEAAKSSMPYYTRLNHQESVSGSMFRFDDHSNEAYAVTAYSYIPASGTKFTGMYKVLGANFQSFSLYASNSTQHAWMVKAEQPFFKKQLIIAASMRKNVFTSMLENSSYQSNTVFKCIQATLRKKHWPVVSLGYFPSSQLMKLGEDKYIENLFYTLVGTVSHLYQYKGISMNTMFSGTRFYNRQADSNFVYFNSTNLLLNQTLFLGRLTLNGGFSSAINQDYAIHGADADLQYKVRQWLDVGGGLKYNYQTVYQVQQLGYTANARVIIPVFGEISLMADKGFVPGANRQLVPNNTGRLTYTKMF